MSAVNIDPSLALQVGEGTMEILNKPVSNKKGKKKEMVVKPRCSAAVRIPTIGKAYLALEQKEKDGSPILVFIEKKHVDGEIKESSYRCCSKTVSGETNFCNMHLKKHTANSSDVRIFTSDFMEKASEDPDSDIRQAKQEDSYFTKMDKERGSRPRKEKGFYKLDKSHPFRIALDSKDPRVLTKAMRSVQEILRQDAEKRGKRYVVDSESESDSDEEEEEISTPKKKSTEKNTKKPMKNRSTHASDSEEEKPKKAISAPVSVDFGSDEEVEEETLPPPIEHMFPDEEEDDGESYENIKTTRAKNLYFFPKTQMLYAPLEDSDESEPIGKMIPIDKEHAHILYKKQYYTALAKIRVGDKNFLHCELDDKVYDFHVRYLGSIIKKGRKFEIQFK